MIFFLVPTLCLGIHISVVKIFIYLRKCCMHSQAGAWERVSRSYGTNLILFLASAVATAVVGIVPVRSA